MVIAVNKLLSSVTKNPTPRVEAHRIRRVTFEINATATLYPALTPVAFANDTLEWVVWAFAGSATEADHIKGFMWPDGILLSTTEQVVGLVMTEGKCSRHDVQAARPSGETEGNLDTSLRQDHLHVRGLYIDDLADILYDGLDT